MSNYTTLSTCWGNHNTIKVKNYKTIKVKNPYSDTSLDWCSKTNEFCKNNAPNSFDFDRKIKEHIIEYSLKLPLNYGIIDCGAHIGDGSIPIADALIRKGRGDITVYAIEPSPKKCNFIRKMALMNNLYNIRVINYGLSNRDNTKYTYAVDENWVNSKNTGAIRWHDINEKNKIAKNREQIEFIKLDTLINKCIIDKLIGYIHFDVENMEPEAIKGGINLFKRDKPILSAETHTEEHKEKILDILSPLGYKFTDKIESNSIFICN